MRRILGNERNGRAEGHGWHRVPEQKGQEGWDKGWGGVHDMRVPHDAIGYNCLEPATCLPREVRKKEILPAEMWHRANEHEAWRPTVRGGEEKVLAEMCTERMSMSGRPTNKKRRKERLSPRCCTEGKPSIRAIGDHSCCLCSFLPLRRLTIIRVCLLFFLLRRMRRLSLLILFFSSRRLTTIPPYLCSFFSRRQLTIIPAYIFFLFLFFFFFVLFR